MTQIGLGVGAGYLAIPVEDEQTAVVKVPGGEVRVPFRGKPLQGAAGAVVGGELTLASSADGRRSITLGGGGGFGANGSLGMAHWRGTLAANLYTSDGKARFSVEGGYLGVSIIPYRPDAPITTRHGGVALMNLSAYVDPKWAIYSSGGLAYADGAGVLLNIGVRHELGRMEVESARQPEPDKRDTTQILAALNRAKLLRDEFMELVDPRWDDGEKRPKEDYPVRRQVQGILSAAKWLSKPDSQRAPWRPRTVRAILSEQREATDMVLAYGSPEAGKVALALQQWGVTATANAAKDLTEQLADGDKSALTAIKSWGITMATTPKRTRAHNDRLHELVTDYVIAIGDALSVAEILLPLSNESSKQQLLKAQTTLLCLKHNTGCPEDVDPAITVPKLLDQWPAVK